jgi:hypothetical protein
MEIAEAFGEDVMDMKHTDCEHPRVEIPHLFGIPGCKVRVDARIAPLVAQMRDLGPSFASEQPLISGVAEFVFLDRSSAAEFMEFDRSGEFEVYFPRDEIRVLFPVEWVDGLTERYRRYGERWAEEARGAAALGPCERRAPHSTVTLNGIEIDADLAPLIAKLWDARVKATCCQEREPGVAWIQFPSPAEALRFFVPASTLVESCGWIVDDGHDFGDDFEANPIGCITVELPREDLGLLTRLWEPGTGGGG